ncbi:secreted RxLR effector protein 161-like [Nicotiana tabacum]|uniref:Secreted RxLR effector protein 161-like n=1 Tax=Nicotiana tabacum TaxID=4097 RepID=A0AC58RWP0_TOBAC
MISQQKYIKEHSKRFQMENSKIIYTPIATATRLDMDETGSHVNETMYRGFIGFQSNPKESHLKADKRILRYLKGTQDLVLHYPSRDNFVLIGCADANYAGYLVDIKSTSGMAHFLGSYLISWGTRNQNSVALSTAKAEYVVVASCCAQLLWIKQQLEDFIVFSNCVPLLCDNTSALDMAKNPV